MSRYTGNVVVEIQENTEFNTIFLYTNTITCLFACNFLCFCKAPTPARGPAYTLPPITSQWIKELYRRLSICIVCRSVGPYFYLLCNNYVMRYWALLAQRKLLEAYRMHTSQATDLTMPPTQILSRSHGENTLFILSTRDYQAVYM